MAWDMHIFAYEVVMIKLFFTAIIVTAILVFIFIILKVKRTALSLKKPKKQENIKENDTAKLLCPNCKTGKESYQLDRLSESCPYIECMKDGKCKFYMPV